MEMFFTSKERNVLIIYLHSVLCTKYRVILLNGKDIICTFGVQDQHFSLLSVIPFEIRIQYDDTLARNHVYMFLIVCSHCCYHHRIHLMRKTSIVSQFDIA
jgi:hypothetical protein